MPGASQTIEVDVSPDTLFDVIVDYAKYPEFLDSVGTVSVLNSSDASALVKYEVEVIKKVHYTLKMSHQRPNKVTWSLDSSNVMKRSEGSWELTELPGGRTRATYTIDVKPKGLVPGPIVKALTSRTLPATLDAFKKRAESV